MTFSFSLFMALGPIAAVLTTNTEAKRNMSNFMKCTLMMHSNAFAKYS